MNKTELHYHKENLYNEILIKLKELGVDLNNVSRKDIAGVDEFHVRGAEVSKELAIQAGIKNASVLDVGCGIGGPCRMLADDFSCKVTGIDLSEEFIKTAAKLSQLVGLENSTTFVCGDATELPFDDHSFNAAWTQHVQMNIKDKQKFYSEIHRVIEEGGTFIYYDIFKKGDLEVEYPMPWAHDPSISFLSKYSDFEKILSSLGFIKVEEKDQTSEGIGFFETLLEKIVLSGPPKLGLNVIMGATTIEKISNLLNGLKEEKLILHSGIYNKRK